MATFTVSMTLLEKVQLTELSYLACILFCFTNEQNCAKLAVDNNRVILSKYKEVSNNRDIIKTWLDLIANVPSSIEIIDVDLNDLDDSEKMCLSLCARTNGPKQMIVYSLSSLKSPVDNDYCIAFEGCKIRVLDKDEAKLKLNSQPNISIINSQVAGGNMNKSKNICHGKR